MIEQASLVIGEGNWAVKSDSLLGYKINNGKYYPREMSVVRATTGTRINEDGLVEVVPYNLFTYSSSFDNAAWGKSNVTLTSGQSGYDGTTNAFLITDNSTNAVHLIGQTPIVSGQHTVSIYAKANTLNWLWLRGVQSSANVRAWFNLSTGTVGTVETNGTANMESVGNGWYRCELTVTNHQSGFEFYVGVSNANSVTSYVGSGQSIYIQDAQLVEGSSALDYLPTTDRLDVARIDYSSGSAALLVEPQRTNLLTYSSSFDNAAWVKYYVTANANTTTSPSGIQDADKLVETSDNNIHLIIQGTLWNTNARTATIYVKAAERTKVFIANTSSAQGSFFNLANGTIEGNIGSFTSTIEDVGNGWYRCTATHTAAASQTFAIGIYTNYTGNFVTTTEYAGTNGSGIYIWGAQLEVGSYPTSLIPTQGSTVTRNADVISKTGIADLIGTEFTVFLDAYESFGASTRYLVLKGSGGTYANAVLLEANSSNRIALTVLNNSSATVFGALSSALTSGQRFKLAVRCKNNDFAFYVNGTQVSVQTSGSVPTTSDLYLGYYSDYSDNYNTINSAVIYKTALTNAELATLTTI